MIIDESFRTSGLAEAQDMVRRVYARAELRESQGEFRYEHVARGEGGVSFTRFKINSEMDIAVDFDGVAAFGVVIDGSYEAESHGDLVDTGSPFLFTPGLGTSRSDELDILMINIDTDVLTASAARLAGADRARLGFGAHNPISPTMREHWLRTINYAWNSVIRVDEVFRNDSIRGATLEAVVTAALAAFPIDVAAAARASDLASSAAIRRAAAFIDDNADQPLTVADLAEAARLSVRALQIGFQRELETTPMGYLRHVRLDAARRELVAADDDTLVADVARRWGFANLGRFAAHYRARFGENPGDTLRR
jgi:AraC-like DNA-binding protein